MKKYIFSYALVALHVGAAFFAFMSGEKIKALYYISGAVLNISVICM